MHCGLQALVAQPAGRQAAAPQQQQKYTCSGCTLPILRHILVCDACTSAFHLECVAEDWMMEAASASAAGGGTAGAAGPGPSGRFGGVPEEGRCPSCGHHHTWMGLLAAMRTAGWGGSSRQSRRNKRGAAKKG